MKLHELKPAPGTRQARKRLGRGIGSGLGKTAGKGHKGQKARSGGGKGPGFEGGQTPLQRRLPKIHRFSNAPFRKEYAVVNLRDLNRFDPGTTVTPELLLEQRVIRRKLDGVKVLGDGQLDRALTVRAHRFSSSAAEKIQAAGGTVEVIDK